jgi:DNA-binding transcriptional MerR regulator
MTAESFEAPVTAQADWTVDELAALVGLTVRNIRYYATLGLIPSPTRRGRQAFYDGRHRARLELLRTMQDQGLSLAAIEQQFSRIPEACSVNELEMRRALVSSWAPMPHEFISAGDLEGRAGRRLSVREIATLERLGHIRAVNGGFELGASFKVGVELLDLDIPVESMVAAGDAIRAHMDALALELREVMRTQVLAAARARHDDTNSAEFAATMTRLRQLTFDVVVGSFQEAANGLVDGSLLGRPGDEA